MSRELVLKALRMAIITRKPEKSVITHTDRGSQYASTDYQMKQEHVFHERYKTRDEARRSVFEWIEGWYNIKRIHSSLGNISPAEYEKNAIVA